MTTALAHPDMATATVRPTGPDIQRRPSARGSPRHCLATSKRCHQRLQRYKHSIGPRTAVSRKQDGFNATAYMLGVVAFLTPESAACKLKQLQLAGGAGTMALLVRIDGCLWLPGRL